jgi:3-methyladenine DNA glycosylase/8-oxoguanine DNA glycosylase
MSARATLKVPARHRFDWRRLIFSHGWVYLAPFAWSDQTHTLSRPLRLKSGRSVNVSIPPPRRGNAPDLRAVADRKLSKPDTLELSAQIRRMLRLDDDFSDFHRLCKTDPLLSFAARARRGGLLRGATAFEDVIKTVCTTNCDWRNTKSMCEKLCALDPDGNFPTPARILKFSESQLASKSACGYRARTILTVSRLFSDGKLPLDEWAAANDFDRIIKALSPIWGIGPYALSHILVLLGDYRTIPVDSEILKYLSKTHFNGRRVTPKRAVEPYDRFGDFRFLAFKFARMSRRENYIDRLADGQIRSTPPDPPTPS